MKNIQISPSILSADFSQLGYEIKRLEEGGADMIHVDVMDGHFVPNLSFGPQTVADLRKDSKLFFDVHLMLDQPDRYVDPFIQAGSDLISIHLEPEYDHNATLDKIKKAGVQTGMVINPDTPVEGIIPFLDQLDLVLLMTVFPGFGGQKFIESVLEKAQVIAELRKENQNNFLIEVDGGVGPEHVTPCLESGVDIIVAGTAYYKRDQAGRKEFAEAIELN